MAKEKEYLRGVVLAWDLCEAGAKWDRGKRSMEGGGSERARHQDDKT